jgi:hypothetical protein
MKIDTDLQTFDPEMKTAIQIYVETIQRHIDYEKVFYNFEEKLKAKVSFKNLHISGTPDAYVFNPDLKKLFVFDFKTGFGVIDPVENWQLIIYTLLILKKLDRLGMINDFNFIVDLVIVQPRAYHPDGPIRSWSINYDQLMQYSKKLIEVCTEIDAGRYVSRVGSWCHYCRALHECKVAAVVAGKAMDASGEAMTFDLTPSQLSFELTHTEDALRILTQRFKALQEFVISQIQKGVTIPGWELSSGRGTLSWNKSVKEVINMANTIGINVKKPEAIVTPRQAETLGLDPAIVKHYTYTREGKLRLRKIDPDAGIKMFGKKGDQTHD